MYTVAVRQDFSAQHFLIGGDWGPENRKHSHHYQVEVQLEGTTLDEHGYLMDIADLKVNLEAVVAHYHHRTLNELPEFEGINPSVEHFSRFFCQTLSKRIENSNVSAITVKIWEDDVAWASYREER